MAVANCSGKTSSSVIVQQCLSGDETMEAKLIEANCCECDFSSVFQKTLLSFSRHIQMLFTVF